MSIIYFALLVYMLVMGIGATMHAINYVRYGTAGFIILLDVHPALVGAKDSFLLSCFVAVAMLVSAAVVWVISFVIMFAWPLMVLSIIEMYRNPKTTTHSIFSAVFASGWAPKECIMHRALMFADSTLKD